MKKGSIVIEIVLTVAVVILFVLHFSTGGNNAKKSDSANVENEVSATSTSIVYVNTDSLLLNYEYAKYLNEELLKKEEKSRTDFNEKARDFQNQATEFQRKVQNNGFMSLERAKREEQRLAQKEKDLQELNNRLSNELMLEQNTVSAELRDSLVKYLEELQPKYNFDIVLSNSLGDNVLYSQKGINITTQVSEGLNARYEVSKK